MIKRFHQAVVAGRAGFTSRADLQVAYSLPAMNPLECRKSRHLELLAGQEDRQMYRQEWKAAISALMAGMLWCVSASGQKKSQREAAGLVGPVRTVRTEKAQIFLQGERTVEGPRMLTEMLVYDAAGRLLESGEYLPGETPDTKSTWKYDNAGREIEHCDFVQGSLVSRSVSTYDQKGRIRELATYDHRGALDRKVIYEYKASGRQARVTEYGREGAVTGSSDETYDAQGRLLESSGRGAPNQSKHIYTYDAAGNRTSEVEHYVASGSPHDSKSVYIFAEDGRLREETEYRDAALSSRKTYQYDNRGNPIRMVEYKANGEIQEGASLVYEYGSDGNWTKATITLSPIDPNSGPVRGYVAYRSFSVVGDKAVELWLAAKSGDLNAVKTAIEQGADVNAKDSDGRAATVLASREGHAEVVRLLLSKGVPVDTKDNEGWTALMWAAELGHIDVVKLLLGSGASVNARNHAGGAALMPAALQGHTEVVRLLLSKGADVNAEASDGTTALMAVAGKGGADMARLLLSNGGEVNARTRQGATPLMFAAVSSNLETARVLLENGADLNAKTEDGKTALSIASEKEDTEMVRLLKDAKTIK
jgi:YD repeat-containing protein